MSASVLVNREETLEILDDALDVLPEELRHARWLLKEQEEYLAQARRDAEDIVEAARVQAERMVDAPRSHGRRGASPSRSSPTPRPTAGACATRPRTTSTRSWRPSRWCWSARCRPCSRARAAPGRRRAHAARPEVETPPQHRRDPAFSTRTTSNRRTGHRAALMARLLSSCAAPGHSGRHPRGPLPLAATCRRFPADLHETS